MKKLLIFLLLASSSTAFGTLRYNPKTRIYHSENAPRNVNQKEYNALIHYFATSRGILNMSSYELAALFIELRSVGTPAALQIIRDTEEGLKEYKKEIKRIQNL